MLETRALPQLQPADRVAVLGAHLQMPGVPTDQFHGDAHGMLAGNWRVLGAVARYMIELRAHEFVDGYVATPVVFTGGVTTPVDGPVQADIPTEALAHEQLFDAIITRTAQYDETLAAAIEAGSLPARSHEIVSTTTQSGIRANIEQLANENLLSIEFITNLYHVPRTHLMAQDMLVELDLDGLIDVNVSPSEDYASTVFGKPFDKQFAKAYASPLGLRRLYYESVGIAAYLAREYNSAPTIARSFDDVLAENGSEGFALHFIVSKYLVLRAIENWSTSDSKYIEHMIEMLEIPKDA